MTDAAAESNQTAYVAVGTWHEFLLTGDTRVPGRDVAGGAPGDRVRARTCSCPRGEIVWQRTADGTPAAVRAADRVLQHLPEPGVRGPAGPAGRRAATALGAGRPAARSRGGLPPRGVRGQEPVLDGLVLPGARPARCAARPAAARLDSGWAEFVVPGLGVRCVSDEPWVTGGGNLRAGHGARRRRGLRPGAAQLFGEVQHLRDADGGYWTGWQYANQAHFPAERSSWTAAAMILAADALSGATAGSGLFRDGSRAVATASAPVDPAACGCGPAASPSADSGARCAPGPGAIPRRSPRRTRRTPGPAGRSGTGAWPPSAGSGKTS